jgi:hypothetical protein
MKHLLKRIFRLNYVFYFFFSSTLFLYLPQRYEKKVLESYVEYATKEIAFDKNNQEKLALHVMNKMYYAMNECGTKSIDLKFNWLEVALTSPTMVFGMSKDGACGGYSLVLAQVLQKLGFEIRPLQMKVGNKFGGHIVLEVKINEKWCVVDPLYNLSFKNSLNQLASAKDLKQNWNFYKTQLPTGYNSTYKYDDFRYSNWERFSYFGSFIKNTISLFCGKEKAETFSFRSKFLNPRTLLFKLSLTCLVLSSLFIIYRNVFKKRINLKIDKNLRL